MAMISGMKQFNLTVEETASCHQLMATAFLNMSICQFLMKDFAKSVKNAEKSVEINKSIKGYYRLGQGQKAMKNYDGATKSFKAAIMIDTSDPNDIQTELKVVERLEKAKEKERLKMLSEKMSKGF